ncbi:hypothetical protein, partial [Vibrio sp. 1F279]
LELQTLTSRPVGSWGGYKDYLAVVRIYDRISDVRKSMAKYRRRSEQQKIDVDARGRANVLFSTRDTFHTTFKQFCITKNFAVMINYLQHFVVEAPHGMSFNLNHFIRVQLCVYWKRKLGKLD